MELTILNKNLKGKLALIMIIVTWVAVAIIIIWHFISVIWVLIHYLISKNLYIPESVRMTSYSIIVVLAWSLVVYLLNITWVAYNNFLMTKKEQMINNSNRLKYIEKDISWSEAMISKVDSQNILEEVEKIKKNLAVICLHKPIHSSHSDLRDPQKLLNLSVAFMKKGQLLSGLSILRIILEHPDSSPLVKGVARIKLAQCIYELGYRDIANGFVEKVI